MLNMQHFWIASSYWTPAFKISNFQPFPLHMDYKTENPTCDSHSFSTLPTFPLVLTLPEVFCYTILFMKESK